MVVRSQTCSSKSLLLLPLLLPLLLLTRPTLAFRIPRWKLVPPTIYPVFSTMIRSVSPARSQSFLVAPLGGILVDRSNRREVLSWTTWAEADPPFWRPNSVVDLEAIQEED